MGQQERHVKGHGHAYLPAMTYDRLLPLYDAFTWLLGVRRVHRRLAVQADIRPGARVLEIGTGTGNLALLVAGRYPGTEIIGLDPDPLALAVARRKSARRGLSVQWDLGMAGELPYPDASVDRVLSSLMFHHLDEDEKARALAEVRRVLTPDGSLHLADFGGHHGPLVRRLFRNNPHVRGNEGDAIPQAMRAAGFADVVTTDRRAGMTYFRATR